MHDHGCRQHRHGKDRKTEHRQSQGKQQLEPLFVGFPRQAYQLNAVFGCQRTFIKCLACAPQWRIEPQK